MREQKFSGPNRLTALRGCLAHARSRPASKGVGRAADTAPIGIEHPERTFVSVRDLKQLSQVDAGEKLATYPIGDLRDFL